MEILLHIYSVGEDFDVKINHQHALSAVIKKAVLQFYPNT